MGGISLHIQKLAAVRLLNPDVLQFTGPLFEYVGPTIDILFGSSELQAAFSRPEPLAGELVE